MRDPNRILTLIEVLLAYWEENPDLRLGQIISNINDSKYGISKERDIFYLEDEEIINALRELIKKT